MSDSKKPFVIGITGGSGSGKTCLVDDLKERFHKGEVCFISQDNYYRPKEKQKKDEKGIPNFDLPGSIDKKAFREDLEKLLNHQSVERLEYVFNNPLAKAGILTFDPAPIVVVEGIFVFHFKKVRRLIDLSVFLHAKADLKVIRRIRRDQAERNYPLEDILYRYQNHVNPTFEKYIQPYLGNADIIINNNVDYSKGMKVLSGFMQHYLVDRVQGLV